MSVQPFPRQRRVTLRYIENISVNIPAGTYGDYIFRANSITDPNWTGVGHQPYGRDMWVSLYNRFTVVGSKITVRNGYGTNTGVPLVFGVYKTADSTPTATTLEIRMENPYGRYQIQNSAYYSHQSSPAVRMRFNTNEWFGIPAHTALADDTISAVVNTNPTREVFYAVWVGPQDSFSDLATTYMCVQIDYDVIFSEPIWEGGS